MQRSEEQIFEAHRPRLLGLAYRMLGSHAEAEDVVQETYLRWAQSRPSELDSAHAWLMKVCGRLAIDHLRSARVRREHYVGPWLPEPWLRCDRVPSDKVELDESISMAMLVLLERLSAGERASFVLHDVFDMTFDEVGESLGKSPAACRKLASRARAFLRDNRPRFSPEVDEHRRITEAFSKAVHAGDLGALESLLCDDVAIVSDGGGKASALRDVLRGREAVGRFLIRVLGNLRRKRNDGTAPPEAEAAGELRWFNGAPGWLRYVDGELVTAMSWSVVDGKIQEIYALRNPDKLAHFDAADESEGRA